MSPTFSLFHNSDPKKWKQVFDIYWDVIEAMAAKKKRILELDRCLSSCDSSFSVLSSPCHTAVLCAGAPELTAFMADEAVESLPGLTPIQYNLKHYMRFLEEIRKKTEALNAESEEEWTPHRVELCLWAWKVGQKLCPKLLETPTDEEERPTKKQKTKS
ncbi:uncharacterized protein PAF06_013980 [Gastrophryne carolinensis]